MSIDLLIVDAAAAGFTGSASHPKALAVMAIRQARRTVPAADHIARHSRRPTPGEPRPEAQVSHATVHRVDDILAEWNAKVARPVLRTPGEAARDETISGLRKHLREARAEITQLNGKLDALATVTTNLYHENLALKRRDNDRRLAPLPTSE